MLLPSLTCNLHLTPSATGLGVTSALAWAPASHLLERGYSCIYCQPWLLFGLPWICIIVLSPATPDWTPGSLKMDPRSGSACLSCLRCQQTLLPLLASDSAGLCLDCPKQCLCWSHPWLPASYPSWSRPSLLWQPALHGQYLRKSLWCYHALMSSHYRWTQATCYLSALMQPRNGIAARPGENTNCVMCYGVSRDWAEFFQTTLLDKTCCLVYVHSSTTFLHIMTQTNSIWKPCHQDSVWWCCQLWEKSSGCCRKDWGTCVLSFLQRILYARNGWT